MAAKPFCDPAISEEVKGILRDEFFVRIPKSHLHRLLQNRFYLGEFLWQGKQYGGEGQTSENGAIELRHRRRNSLSHLQKALRSDLPKGQE